MTRRPAAPYVAASLAAASLTAAGLLAVPGCGFAHQGDLRPSEERLNEVGAQQAFFHLNQALTLLDARAGGRCSAGQQAIERHADESARLLAQGRAVELQSIMRRVVDLVDPVMTTETEKIEQLRVELHAVAERANLKEEGAWPNEAMRSCSEADATARFDRPEPPIQVPPPAPKPKPAPPVSREPSNPGVPRWLPPDLE